MGRDHSNLAQLSKHNLGGTITVPNLTATSAGSAARDRLELGKADLRRLCGTFGVDYAFLECEMMERITTGVPMVQAISWAKSQAMQRKSKLVEKEVTE